MRDQVYFIECNGSIKIGRAIDVAKRMQTLKVGNPRKLTLLGTVPPGSLERCIHDRLVAHRVTGEWFRDCAPVRELIAHLLKFGELPAAPERAPRPDDGKHEQKLRGQQKWVDLYNEFLQIVERGTPDGKGDAARALIDGTRRKFKVLEAAWDYELEPAEECFQAAEKVLSELGFEWAMLRDPTPHLWLRPA